MTSAMKALTLPISPLLPFNASFTIKALPWPAFRGTGTTAHLLDEFVGLFDAVRTFCEMPPRCCR